jgi:hypothetical protein
MSEFRIDHNIGDFPQRLQRLSREVRQELLDSVSEDAEQHALSLYQRVVQAWRHRPNFRVRSTVRPSMVTIKGGTDDPVFNYVDRGTRAHIITPRGEGYPLRFREGYTAKTIPGYVGRRAAQCERIACVILAPERADSPR